MLSLDIMNTTKHRSLPVSEGVEDLHASTAAKGNATHIRAFLLALWDLPTDQEVISANTSLGRRYQIPCTQALGLPFTPQSGHRECGSAWSEDKTDQAQETAKESVGTQGR